MGGKLSFRSPKVEEKTALIDRRIERVEVAVAKPAEKTNANQAAKLGPGWYEVETIIDSKVLPNGKKQFLIKWKGYDSTHNSWEPRQNVSEDLIKEFEQSRPQATTKKAAGKKPKRLSKKPASTKKKVVNNKKKSRGAKANSK